MNTKILVVDDEKNIVDILKYNLQKEGFEVVEAYDGQQAIDKAFETNPDLVLLDIMLPEIDGFSVCMKLRERLSTPILMLTAKEDEIDRVLGLELGADDFITKPFSARELMARVKANLRRVAASDYITRERNVLKYGSFVIDFDSAVIKRDGEIIELTQREYELVKFLALNRGEVFTREEIANRVWGYQDCIDIRIVDATIGRIKMKLEKDFSSPQYIKTKRSDGYYFSSES